VKGLHGPCEYPLPHAAPGRREQPGEMTQGHYPRYGHAAYAAGHPRPTGLERHPKVGASWEAFALRQITQRLGALPQECYFWSVHSGAEIDLLWIRGRRRWGFEFQRTSSPALSRSLMNAVEELKLQRAFVVHAGEATFPVHKKVIALAVGRLLDDLPGP